MRRLICVAALIALAAPAAARANGDTGGGRWAPGSLLVKVRNVRGDEAYSLSKALDGDLVDRLPSIPNGWEIRVKGSVTAAVEKAYQRGDVEWAQPNYYEKIEYFATPQDKAYWPNDPGFWPQTWANPNKCLGKQSALGQPGMWPWYGDLTNSLGPWNQANPIPSSNRLRDSAYYSRAGLAGIGSSSIDVLPVWNALGRQLAHGEFADADLERLGIAVWDTGLSNAPDLGNQVAALYSVGRERTFPSKLDRASERLDVVYTDSPERQRKDDSKLFNGLQAGGDLALLGNLARPSQQRTQLMPIDDVGSGPLGSAEQLPSGCDGHGTEVASVAGAVRGNERGIAGLAGNAPLVGIRPAVPVLDSALQVSQHHGDQRAILDAAEAAPRLDVTDESMINALGIVKILGLPVLNMSWGAQPFAAERVDGRNEVVVRSPALVEAMGRTLSDGKTLGVAAAGGGQYGIGANGVGAALGQGAADAVKLPCALRAVPSFKLKLKGPNGKLEPFDSGVNWGQVNVICVTGTATDSTALIPHAGGGEASVDLAAPGTTTVLSRPTGADAGNPVGAMRLATGTSFSAAMVSGAAALLRQVANKAPMPVIAQALRAGARPRVQLARSVRYGQLDIACSALWLARQAKAHEKAWKLLVQPSALEVPETRHCFKADVTYVRQTWKLPKSDFATTSVTEDDGGLSRVGQPRRQTPEGLTSAFAQAGSLAAALGYQNFVLGPEVNVGVTDLGGLAFFPIGSGPPLQHPQNPPARPVYNFQGRTVACPEGSRLSAFSLRWADAIHPQGYIWFSPRMDMSSVTFMVALIKPWYDDLLPGVMRIAVNAQCVHALPPDAIP